MADVEATVPYILLCHKHTLNCAPNSWLCVRCCSVLQKKMHRFSCSQTGDKTWIQNLCNTSVWICILVRNTGLIILVTHWMSNTNWFSFHCSTWINMGFYADQYLLLREMTFLLRWNKLYWWKEEACQCCTNALMLCKLNQQFSWTCPQSSTIIIHFFLLMCLLLVFLLAGVTPVAHNLFTFFRLVEVFVTCSSGNFHLNYGDIFCRIGI